MYQRNKMKNYEEIKKYRREYYREYRKKDTWKKYKATQNAIRYDRIKTEVFNHYGRECVFCGERRFDKLSIDHPNNDGAQHRKEIGVKCGGINFYAWLIENNFPPGFQVLCISCNSRKNALWMKVNHIGFFAHPRKPKTEKPKPQRKNKPIPVAQKIRCLYCNRKLINNLCLCGRKQAHVATKKTIPKRVFSVDELISMHPRDLQVAI